GSGSVYVYCDEVPLFVIPTSYPNDHAALLENALVHMVAPRSADLSIQVAAPATAPPGAATRIALAVRNAGPDRARGAVARVTLPPAARFIAASGAGAKEAAIEGQVVTFPLGTMAAGTDLELALLVQLDRAAAGAELQFTASVASADADPAPESNIAH